MRASRPNRWQEALQERAAGQEGLLRHADLEELGLGAKAVHYRVRSGRVFRHHPGVYALGPGPYPRPTAWLAALWALGGETTLSHVSAGAFHGHGDEPDLRVVHVTTTRDLASRPGIVVHRTRHLDRLDWSQHGLLRVTNRSRTLVDEAALLTFPELRARADKLRVLPVTELEATLARAPGRPGARAARRLLGGDQRHTKSKLERRYQRFCRRTGLAPPSGQNAWVAGHKADCVYAAERLVIELDGRAYHERKAQLGEDHRRDADYQLARFRILRLTWWDLQPEWEVRTRATVDGLLRLG